MNHNNLVQIFQHYIDRFDFLNNEDNCEYYKWQVCQAFPGIMNAALAAEDTDLSRILNEARKITYNFVDSFTQPFAGLVKYAQIEPATVRKMFLDLYSDDGGDIRMRMEKIADFFTRSNELLEKYTPDSYLYRQDSRSVSALLFLYDPDQQYMYKATQSREFADCVEFYDDWGIGDNIKLDVYYRMCDELIAAINDCPELLNTDKSRFDGRLRISGGDLHPDTKKHILAYDIIFCCSVYDLFDGISYKKRNTKEKQQFLAGKEKAEELKRTYDKAKADYDQLEDALRCFTDMISVGDEVSHKKYGAGTVKFIDEKYIVASFSEKDAQISLPIGIANGIISMSKAGFSEKVAKYKELLKKHDAIPRALEYAARALKPYEEHKISVLIIFVLFNSLVPAYDIPLLLIRHGLRIDLILDQKPVSLPG